MANPFSGTVEGFGQLKNVLDALGGGLAGMFASEQAVYAITLIGIVIISGTIFKEFLKHLPIFRGEGSATTNKAGSIIAWTAAIMGAVFLGWRTGGNMSLLISLFGGPSGELIIVGIAAGLGYAAFRGFEHWRKRSRVLIGILVSVSFYSWIQWHLTEEIGIYILLMFIVAIAFGIGWLSTLRRH